MSRSWKLGAKRVHRERGQPHERQHLGFLEHRKDQLSAKSQRKSMGEHLNKKQFSHTVLNEPKHIT